VHSTRTSAYLNGTAGTLMMI